MFTNPPLEDHKAAVKAKYVEMIDNKMDEGDLGDALKIISKGLGSFVIDGIIDSRVSRANYVLFSLTQLQKNSEKKVVGIGIFGNVFIPEDLNISKEDLLNSAD